MSWPEGMAPMATTNTEALVSPVAEENKQRDGDAVLLTITSHLLE